MSSIDLKQLQKITVLKTLPPKQFILVYSKESNKPLSVIKENAVIFSSMLHNFLASKLCQYTVAMYACMIGAI